MTTSPSTRAAKRPAKKTKKKAAPARCPNLTLALAAINELVAAVCDCGHFDSEHLGGGKKACDSSPCGCPSFKKAFDLDIELE